MCDSNDFDPPRLTDEERQKLEKARQLDRDLRIELDTWLEQQYDIRPEEFE